MSDLNFTGLASIVLPDAIIEEIKKWVFDLEIERCANISLVDGNVVIVDVIDGESIMLDGKQLRGACRYARYSKIILHTHPVNLYPLPSPEDITKLLKYKHIYNSLIGCKWGIWKISNNIGRKKLVEAEETTINKHLKQNYIDPRIVVSWCKKNEVPIEKIFNSTILEKFTWSMETSMNFDYFTDFN